MHWLKLETPYFMALPSMIRCLTSTLLDALPVELRGHSCPHRYRRKLLFTLPPPAEAFIHPATIGGNFYSPRNVSNGRFNPPLPLSADYLITPPPMADASVHHVAPGNIFIHSATSNGYSRFTRGTLANAFIHPTTQVVAFRPPTPLAGAFILPATPAEFFAHNYRLRRLPSLLTPSPASIVLSHTFGHAYKFILLYNKTREHLLEILSCHAESYTFQPSCLLL
ncbi:hypothetical protein HanPI659440_Chr04g0160391 [Helianthus annuus]|nr:hypothetical protein HanPI659440_Chr04g0160391 [Helianthus annuus]